MQYKLREIAEELQIPESTLRDWLSRGAPHIRDARNHIWIDGRQFALWVKDERIKKTKCQSLRSLKEGEAYCLRCNQIVTVVSPVVRRVKGQMVHMKGTCPICGCTVNRGGRHDRTSELQES